MIEVHHLENSRSQRVIWLLEELAADYEVITYQRDPKTMLAPESLKQVHPLGKSPVIVDTEREGEVVAESGAIIEYLLERFDALVADRDVVDAKLREHLPTVKSRSLAQADAIAELVRSHEG